MNDVLEKDPNILSVTNNVGGGFGPGGGGSNTGRLFVNAKPRAERELSVDEIIANLRPKMAAIPGISVFMVNAGLVAGPTLSRPFRTTAFSARRQRQHRHRPRPHASHFGLQAVRVVRERGVT